MKAMLWTFILIISTGICVKSEEFYQVWENSQVLIYTIDKSQLVEGKCFGTLVSQTFVLTMATCVLQVKHNTSLNSVL